jgi:hypothetical protein
VCNILILSPKEDFQFRQHDLVRLGNINWGVYSKKYAFITYKCQQMNNSFLFRPILVTENLNVFHMPNITSSNLSELVQVGGGPKWPNHDFKIHSVDNANTFVELDTNTNTTPTSSVPTNVPQNVVNPSSSSASSIDNGSTTVNNATISEPTSSTNLCNQEVESESLLWRFSDQRSESENKTKGFKKRRPPKKKTRNKESRKCIKNRKTAMNRYKCSKIL